MSSVERAPLALIAILILILLLGGMELGHRVFAMWQRRRGDDEERRAPDHLLSAMLGLLALLLGFTFALALNRYEMRRDLVVQEANAIGTTWLRAQLISEPERGRMSALLHSYVDARILWSNDPADMASLEPTSALQKQLWSELGSTWRHEKSGLLSRALTDSMNESFDLASARVAGRNAHIPLPVLAMLMLCATLTAVMLGFMMGTQGRRYPIATTFLNLLVGLVMLMIFDLDRPVGGLIQVSQQPLESLRSSLQP